MRSFFVPFTVGLLLIIAFANTNMVKAQSTGSHQLAMAIGLAKNSVQDQGASPLIYRGKTIHGGLAYLHQKNKYAQRLQILFDAGSMKPDVSEGRFDQKANLMKAGIRYGHERSLTQFGHNKYLFQAGGEWGVLTAFRNYQLYTNNNINYDFASWLGISATIRRELLIRQRRITASWNLAIPIVTFVVRPSFASSIPPGYFETGSTGIKTFFKSGDIVSINHWQQLRSNIALTYHLANTNALRLSYEWEYYNYNKIPENSVGAASHTLSLAILFSF